MGCMKCDAIGIPIKDAAACYESGTQDLVVPEEETLIINPHEGKYASFFAQVNPKSMGEMKKLIGLPDGLHATAGRERFSLPSAPVRYIGQSGPEADASNVFVRAAMREFIYRDSVFTAALVPVMEKLLPVVFLHVGEVRDLTVKRGSTLVIPRGVDRLTVRDLTIEQGASLVIRGSNLLLRVRSLRGETPAPSTTTLGIITTIATARVQI